MMGNRAAGASTNGLGADEDGDEGDGAVDECYEID